MYIVRGRTLPDDYNERMDEQIPFIIRGLRKILGALAESVEKMKGEWKR